MAKKTKGLSPMDYALSYLTGKDRTYWEMFNYLDSKDFGEADIESTLARLEELKLIDDRRYASRFIQTRLASKPLSKEHIRRQLFEHHINKDIIDEAIAEVSDDSDLINAIEVANKFYRQFSNLDPEKRRLRVLSRLQACGFSLDICCKAFEQASSYIDEELEK